MDVNGDGSIVYCTADQAACKDNEYGHLYYYGAGTVFESGITPGNSGPFSNVQSDVYWSGTASSSSKAWRFAFAYGGQIAINKGQSGYAWAVQSGNVGAVPVPAAVWLFGSGLIGLLGFARRRNDERV